MPLEPDVYLSCTAGLGDCLHGRAVVRHYAARGPVWLKTHLPDAFHGIGGLRFVAPYRRRKLTHRRNVERNTARYHPEPSNAVWQRVGYSDDQLRAGMSLLQATCASAGIDDGDFRLRVPDDWLGTFGLPDKPLMIVRPLTVRREFAGTAARNPEPSAYAAIYAAIRHRFHVVSVADIDGSNERLIHAVEPDQAFHCGELTLHQLFALFQRAALVMTAPGFGVVLAQAVGTPSLVVFGGYESARSFAGGAAYAPMLAIEPDNPCSCYDPHHACDKRIDLDRALLRAGKFVETICEF